MARNWLNNFGLMATLAALGWTCAGQAASGGAARAAAPLQRQASSRVRDLVNFYEKIELSSQDPELAKRQSVVLSLAEAASKLHVLSHGLAPERKCSKYFRLIAKPNVRTVASVSELMKENLLFSESIQLDANLSERLASERDFNALARIQTILQTLEAERSLGKSNFEPAVERDLLACVNYYIYRHQTATDTVIGFVRAAMNKIKNAQVESSASELLVKQFAEPLDEIRQLELEGPNKPLDLSAWLHQMAKLQGLIVAQNFEIPASVEVFLNEPERLARIESLAGAAKTCADLVEKITTFEASASKNIESDPDYCRALLTLSSQVRQFSPILDKSLVEFVNDPTRQRIIQLKEAENRSSNTSAEESNRDKTSTTSQPTLSPSIDKLDYDETSSDEPRENGADPEGDLFFDVPQVFLEPEEEEPLGINRDSTQASLESSISKQEEPISSLAELKIVNATIKSTEEVHKSTSYEFQAVSTQAQRTILEECNDFLEIKYEAASNKIINSMAKLLDTLNTECYLSNFKLWTGNHLKVQQFELQDYFNLREEIADKLESICFVKIANDEQSLNRQDCALVSEIYEMLRKQE